MNMNWFKRLFGVTKLVETPVVTPPVKQDPPKKRVTPKIVTKKEVVKVTTVVPKETQAEVKAPAKKKKYYGKPKAKNA